MTTANYKLPQWANNDQFNVIGQLNPAFAAIDTSLHSAATTATSAKNDAADALSDAATAQSAANQAQTVANSALTTAQSAQTSASSKVSYGKVKLVEDGSGNGVIVTLGVVSNE